ncbi:MAG: response regulator [Elusimicrobiota bacterium]|nr:MAG: response regulator [Elusimicrobiota bacterium]
MNTGTILVADDEPDNRAIMAAVLSASGYSVLTAADGEQAVSAALRERPDLILLDMAMPGVSGWEAVRRLKSMDLTKDIPVFAFTAFALAGDELKALEAGCDGYVSKPCVPKDVVRKIRDKVGH